jgi:hypothetical protein
MPTWRCVAAFGVLVAAVASRGPEPFAVPRSLLAAPALRRALPDGLAGVLAALRLELVRMLAGAITGGSVTDRESGEIRRLGGMSREV